MCALVWSQFSCRLLLPVLISYVMFCVCPGMVSVFLPLAVTCVDKLCNVLCMPWYGVSFPALAVTCVGQLCNVLPVPWYAFILIAACCYLCWSIMLWFVCALVCFQLSCHLLQPMLVNYVWFHVYGLRRLYM